MMRNPISRAVKLYRSDILECHGARAIAPIRKPIDQKDNGKSFRQQYKTVFLRKSRAAFITFRNFQSKKKPTPKGASPALVGCMESTLSDNGKSFRQQHKSTFLRKSRAAFITFRKLQTNNRTMQCCDIEWCAITLPLDNAKAQLFYNQCICLIVKHKIRMDELPDVLNPQPIAVDEEESYIVSEIFDDRIDADGTILYAVRWEQDQSTTWEPINNLEGAHETLEEYLLGKNSKAQDTKKKTKRARAPTTEKRASTKTKTAKLKGTEEHEQTETIWLMKNTHAYAILNVKLEREQKAETEEGPEGAGATGPAVVAAFQPYHRWVRGPGSVKRKLRKQWLAGRSVPM